MLIDKAEARAMLPKVGDKLWRTLSYLKWDMKEAPLRRCVVVEVNEQHLRYLVRYYHDGLYECFKVLGEKGD